MIAKRQNDGLAGPARRIVLAGLAGALVFPRALAAAGPIHIAAASDVRAALDQIVSGFRSSHGEISVTYGSTGNLARQIAQGAPFQLFLAADESYAERLIASGHAAGPSVRYAIGRLVLIAQKDRASMIEGGLAAITAHLQAGRIAKFAIANPEHAPYGARARQALMATGAWESLKGRLVLGETVSQATQFVITGAADAGIGALPLLTSGEAAAQLAHTVVPATRHDPLHQGMVLTRTATPGAREFASYIVSGEGQAILARYGFEAP